MKKIGLKKGFLITYGAIGLFVVVAAIGTAVSQNRASANVYSPYYGYSDYNSYLSAYYGCTSSTTGGAWRYDGTSTCTGQCSDSSKTCASVLTHYCDCGAGKCFDPTTRTCVAATKTATATATASKTATTSKKVTEITLKANTFTAFNIPSVFNSTDYPAGLQVCNVTQASSSAVLYSYPKFGLYDWAHGNAAKGTPILPGVGYYGLNSTASDLKIQLCKRSATSTSRAVVLYPNTSGSWFLLGPPYPGEPNKSVSTATWADVEVNFAKAGNQTCNTTACSEKKTLGTLVNEGRIYDKVYEIVDPNGTDADTTFAIKDILTEKAAGANDYWVYVWPE